MVTTLTNIFETIYIGQKLSKLLFILGLINNNVIPLLRVRVRVVVKDIKK